MPHRRLRQYLHRDIWTPLPATASRLRRGLREFMRLWVLAGRGFARDHSLHNASALAFDTVLALVPMLAILLSALRGLGAYDLFVGGTVLPWIDSTFGPASAQGGVLRQAFVELVELGGHADISALGLVGVVFLLYLVLVLLVTVEYVLNSIWGVREPRAAVRRIADYSAILFVTPFALYIGTIGVGPQVDTSWLGPLQGVAVEGVKWFAGALAITFLYLVMPNTVTRFRSAALGGVVGGLLFYGVTGVYGAFQIGVTRYNAIFSGFAAVPMFLVWVWISWVCVLFGAELAAASQDRAAFRWRVLHPDVSPSLRRFLGLRLLVDVNASFLAGHGPRSLRELARAATIPPTLARELLDIAVARGLLARARANRRRAYLPARDPRDVKVTAVLEALDAAPDDPLLAVETEDAVGRRLAAMLHDLDEAAASSAANVTLADLARETPPAAGAGV